MAEKQRALSDAALLEELRARAYEQSRTEGELLEEVDHLPRPGTQTVGKPSCIFENLERRRREEGVEPLSEEEAIDLAQRGATHHEARAQGGAVARAVLDPGVLIGAAISGRALRGRS